MRQAGSGSADAVGEGRAVGRANRSRAPGTRCPVPGQPGSTARDWAESPHRGNPGQRAAIGEHPGAASFRRSRGAMRSQKTGLRRAPDSRRDRSRPAAGPRTPAWKLHAGARRQFSGLRPAAHSARRGRPVGGAEFPRRTHLACGYSCGFVVSGTVGPLAGPGGLNR